MSERDHIDKIMKKQRLLFVFSIKSSQAKCHKSLECFVYTEITNQTKTWRNYGIWESHVNGLY